MKTILHLVAAVSLGSMLACGAAEGDADAPATDEDALKKDNPDPPEPKSNGKCAKEPSSLSPMGLTLIIHVSKDEENGAREVRHLKDMKAYVRERDVFMIEHGSTAVGRLRDLFPCNRFDYIAYPDEIKDALATGDGVDGIAVDWEGGAVDSHGFGWNVDRLHDYVKDIHARGKTAGFVPAWSYQSSDGRATRDSNMDFALAQIQGSCVHSAQAFAGFAHAITTDFNQARNVGFEISMDSYESAPNHVGAKRAADCTHDAYVRGARAIYIYGNGHDELPDYFRQLHQMGIRGPR